MGEACTSCNCQSDDREFCLLANRDRRYQESIHEKKLFPIAKCPAENNQSTHTRPSDGTEEKYIILQAKLRSYLARKSENDSDEDLLSKMTLPKGTERIICEDCSTYTGTLQNGKRTGRGTCVWPNGAKYEGEWENDQFNGQGTFHIPAGGTIAGVWKNSKLNGHAKYVLPTGEEIEGSFMDDVPNGNIRNKKPDGLLFEGECVNGVQCGNGTLTWPDGRMYKGEFKDNEMHGVGAFYAKDGSTYTGEFVKGKRQGKGVYTWKDGRVYEGEFMAGKQHGVGKYTRNGTTRAGRWQNGARIEWITEKQEQHETSTFETAM